MTTVTEDGGRDKYVRHRTTNASNGDSNGPQH